MQTLSALYTGSILISLLHAVLPNHWLPIVAIAKNRGWSRSRLLEVTALSAAAHGGSTLLLGILVAFIGNTLNNRIHQFSEWIAPVLLMALGIFFIVKHQKHKHFHLAEDHLNTSTDARLIWSLTLLMLMSPCLEIEGFFLLAGAQGAPVVLTLGLIYLLATILGMVVWVAFIHFSLQRFNWHKIEHNAGLITGLTLIATGILTFFIH